MPLAPIFSPIQGAADPGFVQRADVTSSVPAFDIFYNYLPSADGRGNRQNIFIQYDFTVIETTGADVVVAFEKLIVDSINEGAYSQGSSLDLSETLPPLLEVTPTTPINIISDVSLFTKVVQSNAPTLIKFDPAMKYRIRDPDSAAFTVLRIHFESLGAGDLSSANTTLWYNEFVT